MAASVDARIDNAVSLHRNGTISTSELTHLLCGFAIESHGFFQHLELIPPEVLTELREIAQNAPAHPEDCLIVEGITEGPNFDHEAYDLATRERHYWASRLLRAHFFPDLPMPEFERLKLAGTVDEVREWEGVVVIFGDISSYLIRNNPIRLVAPTGQVTSTLVVLMDLVDVDRTVTPMQHGKLGLWLDQNVRSAAEVPLGTELWVNRTGVAEPKKPPCT